MRVRKACCLGVRDLHEAAKVASVVVLWAIAILQPATCKTRIKIESILHGQPTGPVNSTIFEDIPIMGSRGVFGLKDHEAQGELMPFRPMHGCSPLQPSQFTHNATTPPTFLPFVADNKVIALIQEDGPCSIDAKIRTAARTQNVVGVIVVHRDDFLPRDMNVESLISSIPVVLIRHSTGAALLQLANWYRSHAIDAQKVFVDSSGFLNPDLELADLSDDTNSIVFRNLTDDKAPSGDDLIKDDVPASSEAIWLKVTLRFDDEVDSMGMVEFSLVILVVLLGVAFITSICLHCYFYRMRQRRHRLNQQHQLDGGHLGPAVLDRSLLDSERLKFLPVMSYAEFLDLHGTRTSECVPAGKADHAVTICMAATSLDGHWMAHYGPCPVSLNETCPICLDEFPSQELVRELPCYHLYHPDCIDEWLLQKMANCPMCKFNVLVALDKRIQDGPPLHVSNDAASLISVTSSFKFSQTFKRFTRSVKRKLLGPGDIFLPTTTIHHPDPTDNHALSQDPQTPPSPLSVPCPSPSPDPDPASSSSTACQSSSLADTSSDAPRTLGGTDN